MIELKTKKTAASVAGFLASIPDPRRREDAIALDALFADVVGESGTMWGPSIVGYGKGKLRYPDGREIDWMLLGFSPRKSAMTLYLGDLEEHSDLLARLGRHSTGKGCLYIKSLTQVNAAVLRELLRQALAKARG
jgi:hypothetical protein